MIDKNKNFLNEGLVKTRPFFVFTNAEAGKKLDLGLNKFYFISLTDSYT